MVHNAILDLITIKYQYGQELILENEKYFLQEELKKPMEILRFNELLTLKTINNSRGKFGSFEIFTKDSIYIRNSYALYENKYTKYENYCSIKINSIGFPDKLNEYIDYICTSWMDFEKFIKENSAAKYFITFDTKKYLNGNNHTQFRQNIYLVE